MSSSKAYEALASKRICVFCLHRLSSPTPNVSPLTSSLRRSIHSTSRKPQSSHAAAFSDPELAPTPPAPSPIRKQQVRDRDAPWAQAAGKEGSRPPTYREGGRSQDSRNVQSSGLRIKRSPVDPESPRGFRDQELPPSRQRDAQAKAPPQYESSQRRSDRPLYRSARDTSFDQRNNQSRNQTELNPHSGWGQLKRRGDQNARSEPSQNERSAFSERPAQSERPRPQPISERPREAQRPAQEERSYPRFQGQRDGDRRFGQHNGDFVGFNRQSPRTSAPASQSLFGDRSEPRSSFPARDSPTPIRRTGPSSTQNASNDVWSLPLRRSSDTRSELPRHDQYSSRDDRRSDENILPRRGSRWRDEPVQRSDPADRRSDQPSKRSDQGAKAGAREAEAAESVDEEPVMSVFERDFDQDEGRRRDKKPKKRSAGRDEPDEVLPKRRAKEDKTTRRAERFADEEEDDEAYQQDQLAKAEREAKKKEKKEKRAAKEAAKEAAKTKKIELPPFISVNNLATALHVRPEAFAQKLEEFGFEDFNNEHVLSFENASLIASEYGYDPSIDRSEIEDLRPRPPPEDVSVLPPRPPVVTIMGHVDHGKTTLLDYMRQSSVAASEHGGITQHIGAFSVPMASGSLITFLDTPGHAAFLSMRQRGANVTDIIILVVAADDSVKPQTIEAIKHAKAAKVPIIVAINKVDKDEADVEQVKQDLLQHDIEVEDFGGEFQAIPVSGKTGQGLDKLEEAIVTQAEILDMRAEQDGPVEGWVLEATTKKAGRVATVLVRRGTLRPGDVIVAGTTWARVRTLKNEAGVLVEEAGPGTPVEVDGWRSQAMAGDEVLQAPTEQRAGSAVEYRSSRLEQNQAAKDMEAININRRREAEKHEQEKAAKEEVERKAKEAGERYRHRGKSLTNADYVPKDPSKTELFIIVKADVSGSAEAIEGSIQALPLHNQPVSLDILRVGVGPVSEFDLDHISAVPDGQGFIISFNQEVPPHIRGEAAKVGVTIMDENIIYKVIDEVRVAVEAKLPPLITRRVTGDAEAAQVFEINTGGRKFSKIAGCKVRNGTVLKGGKVAVYRGNIGDPEALVYEGTISTLKNQKKDVLEMRKGTECGVSFENWEEFQAGDLLQCYEEKKEPRRLL